MSVGASIAVPSCDTLPSSAKTIASAPPNKTLLEPAVPSSPPPFSGASFVSSSPLPSATGPARREVETQTWRRKEREWSGEWNVQDYEHVVKGLRGLKMRK